MNGSVRMKKRVFSFSLCVVIVSVFHLPVAHMSSAEQQPAYKNPRLPVDQRVADLLSRMTLEEKVAQLTCLWANRPQVNPQTDFAIGKDLRSLAGFHPTSKR